MKIIIQNDVKTKLYEDLMKAGINEIKGACFAYNSSPNVFEIEEVYISPVHGTFAFLNCNNSSYQSIFHSQFLISVELKN